MSSIIPRLALLFILILLPAQICLAQTRVSIAVCGRDTFAAIKPLPELEYECPEGLTESSDEILKLPARLAALNEIAHELESFTDAGWWRANVDELNRCELHGGAGPLTTEEREKFRSGDFRLSLFGNHQIRLALLPDPCYQTGFNGSVAFLMYHAGDKVVVTKVLDGYYSRVDNSVDLDFANLNGEQIIEVGTSNSMVPSIRNYYFVIDPRTHKAVPKKLFKQGKTLTNDIWSEMIIGDPSEFGLPPSAKDTKIVSHNRLLPSFTVYEAKYVAGDESGHKLGRTIYRWNGRF